MKAMRSSLSLLLVLAVITGWGAVSSAPFRITVVDAENGWPVPLVQFKTANGLVFTSDNAGVVAVDEPDLLGQTVRFSVEGHGYGIGPDIHRPGSVTYGLARGGKAVLKITRNQVAKRLGRIGGTGLFAESRKFGEHLDKKDQGEVGRDSVQCRPYNGKLFWLWGDTSMQGYAIGIFNTTAAFTPNPAFPLDPKPPVYPPYDQIRNDEGHVRGVIKAQGEGPIWIFGLIDLKDKAGKDHLGGAWSQIRNSLEAYKNGLCVWNDKTKNFDVIQTLMDKEKGIMPEFFPDPNAVHWTDPKGKKWLLYGFPFPHHRIPDSYEAWCDPTTWEKIDWNGKEKIARYKDGKKFEAVGGQMMWNAKIKKWVGICMQKWNLGALCYIEADSPFGPWENGQQIVFHHNYTIYNPIIHVEYGPDTPYLVFEGTYTDAFINQPNPTPRYNYTQMLFRLDLKDVHK